MFYNCKYICNYFAFTFVYYMVTGCFTMMYKWLV